MYFPVLTQTFSNDVKALKKDNVLYKRLINKMETILINPEHYPIKRHNLKGKRSAHVGSYVILFEVKGKEVIFHKFRHHDYVYE
ncbi:MAG: Plasmid stabilization system protein [Candidatus Scalindua rubra]|uniref:Plasmid stabilization system protein n=1 Tax=Candidatus Scalindua rubra TaxID=1872076 RepID=A0A1E3X3R9_9BACT|nr:MAG: Plasmid stabilization system protein [Candidatus Scalindua rubra]